MWRCISGENGTTITIGSCRLMSLLYHNSFRYTNIHCQPLEKVGKLLNAFKNPFNTALRQFISFSSKSQFIFWMLPKNPSSTFHSFKPTAVEIRISKIRYYLLSILVLSSDPISIDSDQQKFDHENVDPKWDLHIIVVRSVFSKVNQSLTDSFCSWGWCHQSCMVMLMLTMRIEETVQCPK